MTQKKSAGDELPLRYDVVITDNFWVSFDAVTAYISKHWWEISVTNFSDDMWRKLNNLATFPNGYPKYRDTKYRRFLVWDYLVIFAVDDISSTVVVYGIYHSAQNLRKIVGDFDES
jgi:plasmid stabilization system protein ParE